MNEDSEEFASALIIDELSASGENIREQFYLHFSDQIESFTKSMTSAYLKWKSFDKKIQESEEMAHISSLIYTAINSHVISMKLLITGYLIAAGNTFRQTLESSAMALLCSNSQLGILNKYMEGKYSTTKAVRDLVRNHKKLSLSREALKALENNIKFYDKFSHTTHMTIASCIGFHQNNSLSFGAQFDRAKFPFYEKEINSRANFARIIINIIEGVELNIQKAP